MYRITMAIDYPLTCLFCFVIRPLHCGKQFRYKLTTSKQTQDGCIQEHTLNDWRIGGLNTFISCITQCQSNHVSKVSNTNDDIEKKKENRLIFLICLTDLDNLCLKFELCIYINT